jgi:hypothetical protein
MARFLLASLLCLIAAPSLAGEDALLQWVSALTGYPVPSRPYTIEYLTIEALSARAERGDDRVEPFGMWDPYTWTIYLDDRLDVEGNKCARSVLAHELTHYLQTPRTAVTGPRSGYEIEALRVTAVYLGVWRLPPWQAHFDAEICESYLRSSLSGAAAWIAPRP